MAKLNVKLLQESYLWRFVSAGIFLILSCFCTASSVDAQPLIIAESQREQWQAIGRVTINSRANSLCTGTLIAPDRVLTAAHCVTNMKTGQIFPFYRVQFAAGWHDKTSTGGSKARSIRIHPAYEIKSTAKTSIEKLRNFGYDLAVIELADPLQDVAPARLTETTLATGPVTILGYRKDRRNKLTDYVGCQGEAGGPTLIALTCKVISGTSGAPVLLEIDGNWQVVGVVVAQTNGPANVRGVAARANTEILQSLTAKGG